MLMQAVLKRLLITNKIIENEINKDFGGRGSE